MTTTTVRPEQTADVQQAMRWAHEHRVPVVIRGAGTRSAATADETGGALVISTERMRTLHIDPTARTASVLAVVLPPNWCVRPPSTA